jgi:hypothetical protein
LRYERVDDEAEFSRVVTAAKKKKKKLEKYPGNRTKGNQRTPADLKGVGLCKSKDHDDTDPKRKPKDQVWCTYDFKGNLRGRHPTKQKAVDHKLFLINMFWRKSPKSRGSKGRPSNKPYKGPR